MPQTPGIGQSWIRRKDWGRGRGGAAPAGSSATRGLGRLRGAGVPRERGICALAEELVEEGPVVLHRTPELFGGAVAQRSRPSEPVTFAVVLDHVRVVDGEVGRPLVEIVHRVAAVGHDGLDQAVRLANRTLRIVDE